MAIFSGYQLTLHFELVQIDNPWLFYSSRGVSAYAGIWKEVLFAPTGPYVHASGAGAFWQGSPGLDITSYYFAYSTWTDLGTLTADQYQQIRDANAPQHYQFSLVNYYSGYFETEYTQYWLTYLPEPVFTENDDIRDFNALSADDLVDVTLAGAIDYAMGGNDTIILPNKDKYDFISSITGISGKWVPESTFFGGDGDDTITGGDGDDKVDGGADNDILIGSKGNDTLLGGEGNDTFDFTALDLSSLGASKQSLDGGGNPDKTLVDKLLLPGSPDQYKFVVTFDATWENTITLVSKIGDAAEFGTSEIEKVEFASPVANKVELFGGHTSTEMMLLAAEVYGQGEFPHSIEPLPSELSAPPTVANAAAQRKWHPVSAMELGLLPADYGQFGGLKYGFSNGFYAAKDTSEFVVNEANALVLSGVVDGKKTLAVVFRGTDEWQDFSDYPSFKAYYDKYKPLTDALRAYLEDAKNGIQQILVSGHSLGAGMVQYFMQDFAAYNVHGYTDGPPGAENVAQPSGIMNFVHTDDIVTLAPYTSYLKYVPFLGPGVIFAGAKPKERAGSDVYINSEITVVPWLDEHDKWTYASDVQKLLGFANDATSPFSSEQLAKDLVANRVYAGGDRQVALGTGAADTINGEARDNYILGGGGDDTIILSQFYPNLGAVFASGEALFDAGLGHTSRRLIDGGAAGPQGNTVKIKYNGLSTIHCEPFQLTWGGQVFGTAYNVYYTNPFGSDEVGIFYNIQTVLVSSVFTGESPIIKPDGAPVNAQGRPAAAFATTSRATVQTLQVDHSFDYTDAGDGALSILGTAFDDVVVLGSGPKTVKAGAGDDTILVRKDADVLSVVNIDAGDGADTVVGGPGTDTLSGGTGDDDLQGGLGSDTLDGGAGNDTLAGGGGNDTLKGGLGDDQYFVDVPGSNIVELLNSGTDTVYSSVSFTLPSNVENLVLTGEADVSGTGNALKNLIVGNSGKNTLDGKLGADTLTGGTGDDTYLVDNVGDVVIENIDEGTDTVMSTVTYTLADNIEDLVLTGTGAINGTGNGLANKITGNAKNNILIGGAGADTLDGGLGIDTASYAADTLGVTVALSSFGLEGDAAGDVYISIENLVGGSGDDNLIGDVGSNRIEGAAGDDVIEGGAGNDVLIGGVNTEFGDTVSYAHAAGKVTVSLALTTAQVTGGAGTDTISGFENLVGSQFDDTLTGSKASDAILGIEGNDLIVGGAGDDWLDGGAGIDAVSYAGSLIGVIVDLSKQGTADLAGNADFDSPGTAQLGGDAEGDLLWNFENVIGSTKADTLTGDAGTNTLSGGAGNDTLTGGDGDDILIGGAGADVIVGGNHGLQGDTASYATSLAGIKIDLRLVGIAQVSTGDAAGDKLSEIENLIGSGLVDTLIGNDADNSLSGGAGNDTLEGGLGNDILDGGAGADTASYASLVSGVKVDLRILGLQDTGAAGQDTLISIENLLGGAGSDTFIGDAGNNVINGAAGDDTIDGGAGNDVLVGGGTLAAPENDTVSYASALAGVVISLALTGAQQTGGAGIDTLSGFENLTGSDFNDTLTGSAIANTITGGDGNDLVNGGAGADKIDGGAGIDTVSYAGSRAGIVVNLSLQGGVDGLGHADFTLAGTAQSGGDAAGDLLWNFENIIGSSGIDTLVGDSNDNVIEGGAGNDILDGGGNTVAGDTVSYASSARGVTVELSNGKATGGSGIDTLLGFENILGSKAVDTLIGDANANRIIGGLGADVLTGGGGADTFVFRALAEKGDRIMDFVSGTDVIEIAASGFTGLTSGGLVLDSTNFVVGPALGTPVANSNKASFLYDVDDGKLYLDDDGIGAHAKVLLLTLDGHTVLTANDLHIV